MPQRGPWSVKGIDSRAREAAREAAREEGMTLGAYLNKLILEEDAPLPSSYSTQTPPPEKPSRANEANPTALDRLTRRIESAEARSTLAITGIDQSVVGLLSRLENAEHNQQAMGGHFEGIMDDIQKTFEALNVKVKDLEADDSPAKNLNALKALEDALGKLASHVYAENELVSEETSAIKMRLESGLGELSERMDTVDAQIEDKLGEATQGLNNTIQDVELRAEGTNRHLAERFSTIELDVAEKFSHVSKMGSTMDTVHVEVTGSLTEMNNTLSQMQERLTRAETATDKAMQTLESRFEALDARLADVKDLPNDMTQQAFQERFETLSEDMRHLVASTRAELAEEIEAATSSVDAELVTQLNSSIVDINTRLDASEDVQAQTVEMVSDTVSRITDSVDQRLTASQDQQARSIEQVGEQVSRISDGLDQRLDKIEAFSGKAESDALREEMIRFTNTLDDRLEYLEGREDETFEKISSEVEKLADRLDERVKATENQSATAIQQVGEQVSNVTKRLEQRQTEALKAFADKFDGTQKRQDARLSSALGNVSDRLERMQEQSLISISPVQKAITALAQRLEAIEDFSAPPYAERDNAPVIPDMVSPSKVDTTILPTNTGQAEEAEPEEMFETNELESFLSPILSTDPEESAEVDNVEVEDFEAFDLLASDIETNFTSPETDITAPETTDEAEPAPEAFEPGYQSWADDANAILDDSFGADQPAAASETTDEDFDLPPPILDDVEAAPVWNDGREEARDNDIFEDDFEAPAYAEASHSVDEFELAATSIDSASDSQPKSEAVAPKDDLISNARLAARNAAESTSGHISKHKKKKIASRTSSGISPKQAGIAALAAVAVAGTAGVLYMRGQKTTPAVNFNADADRLAALTNNASGAPALPTPTLAENASQVDDATTSPTGEDDPSTGDAALLGAAIGIDAGDISEETDTEAAADASVAEAPEVETTEPTPVPELTPASTSGPVDLNAVFSAPTIPKRVSLGKAARDGNKVAQFQAGMADLRAGNLASGATLLGKASDQGLAISQHELAILHEKGSGTTRDLAAARRLHGDAAKGGHIEAMFDFATYNANGEGGETNAQVAAEWFRKAAEFGHADSQYNLAQLYTLGSGVSPSLIEALFWFELAAKSGDPDAQQFSKELVETGDVSADAASKVYERVAAWRAADQNAIANGKFGSQAWDRNPRDQVRAVQQVLAALGYTVGAPDGVMGAQTRTAIRSFETSAGIPVTGQIDDRLVDALNDAADAERGRT